MKIKYLAIFFIVCLICLLIGYNFALLTTSYPIANVASIKTVGVNVFSDSNCTLPVTHIYWETLEPATSKTIPIYVKSVSNVPLNVNVTSENWKPPNCTEYMTFRAEPNSFTLQPAEIKEVYLTLIVAYNIEGITNFTFEVWFYGSG